MRTREEQITPWGYISPFAKESPQYNERCDLTINRKSTVSETMPLYIEEQLREAEQRGYERARAECAADTRRIEYFDRYKTKAISRWNDNLGRYEWSVQLDKWYPTFRAAIDAAMETE